MSLNDLIRKEAIEVVIRCAEKARTSEYSIMTDRQENVLDYDLFIQALAV